ncbi:hypothetical protein [Actinomadura madurae]|uniref:hypothetical protein n=1 Tax=Actinomadura madurae TaxID=1993 RepID=UPI0020D25F3B|nr:hypothetical protein [Actinomadura madurae]MCQ0015816.1 hypothetical protein [Actinomadura madurae]
MDLITSEAAAVGGAVHVPMDEAMARDRRLFASDGFHPSAAGYRAWAQDLARAAVPAPRARPPRTAHAPRRRRPAPDGELTGSGKRREQPG